MEGLNLDDIRMQALRLSEAKDEKEFVAIAKAKKR